MVLRRFRPHLVSNIVTKDESSVWEHIREHPRCQDTRGWGVGGIVVSTESGNMEKSGKRVIMGYRRNDEIFFRVRVHVRRRPPTLPHTQSLLNVFGNVNTSPPVGWVKANSDGSVSDDRYGFGAIVRGPFGDCKQAIAARSRATSNNILELKGILAGLRLCKEYGLKRDFSLQNGVDIYPDCGLQPCHNDDNDTPRKQTLCDLSIGFPKATVRRKVDR
ncbi:hypothetical protein QJS10_CPA03g00867 [Acorus calamus]|uniref:RNase H type-1 domain-containing protein n=1 Tax=Acorus calamus TaxID=4465 RepID=A0AAV9F6W8_ACOCL|nr:hypothetical protein QJS10_CPA03g00867 [Acorus calamus]